MKTREILGALCLLIVGMGAVMQWLENIELPDQAAPAVAELPQSPTPSNAPEEPSASEAPPLLVNAWNPVAEGLSVVLVELPNGQQVAEECFAALTEMLEACALAGGSPQVCSGYRSYEQQAQLYANKVERLMAEGYGEAEASAVAVCSVAYPGTSEHHTGLAVDIIHSDYPVLDETQADTPTQQWLLEHCWDYGFILRYPKDKTSHTGIIYEPWHYRYVGRETAKLMQAQGICLEELYAQPSDD